MKAFFSRRLNNLTGPRGSSDSNHSSSTRHSSTLFAPESDEGGSWVGTDSSWTVHGYSDTRDDSSEVSTSYRIDHSRNDTANHWNTPGLIKVHYGTLSALTFRSELFEELEQAVRKLCVIKEDVPVLISANISALEGRRIRIDQKAWKIVYNEISEIWLTTLSNSSSSGRTISLEPIDEKVNGGQVVPLMIGESETIGDIRQAFVRRFPQYDPQKLLIWSCDQRCEVAGELSDKERVKNARYRISTLLKVESVEIPSFSGVSTTRDTSMGIKRDFGKVNFRISKAGTKMTSEVVAGMGAEARMRFSASRLLVVHHGDSVILTAFTESYEDIEMSSRSSFFIHEDTLVFVTAKLSSSDANPTRIDARIWAAVCSRVSEIWITTEMCQSKGRIVALKHLTSRLCVAVKVEEGSTIGDLKGALSRKFPGYWIASIEIHGAKSTLTNNQYVAEDMYRFSSTRGNFELASPDEDYTWVNIRQGRPSLGGGAEGLAHGRSLSDIRGGSMRSINGDNRASSQRSLATNYTDAQSTMYTGNRITAGGALPLTSVTSLTGITEARTPLMSGTGPTSSRWSYLYRAEALYNYTASAGNPNELSFQKGELLDIVDDSGRWWMAKKADGMSGFVPSTFLHAI